MLFFLDEDLSDKIASIARARGVDVVSSHECERDGLSDEDQLRRAAADGRCLVTGNHRHFTLLTLRSFQNGWPHAGVLFVPPSIPGDRFVAIAEALALYEREHPDGLPPYTIDFLRQQRP